MKKCSKCGVVKDEGEFRKTNAYVDGLMCWCRVCEAAYYIEYRNKNAAKIKTQRSERWAKNKEAIARRRKAEYNENPEKYRERSRRFNAKHPDTVKNYNQEYYLKNSKKIKKQTLEYAKANIGKRRLVANKWRAANEDKIKASAEKTRLKFKDDPKHKLNRNISRGMNHTLKEGKKAGRHWEALVPYTIDQLKKHLEKSFKPGMTWDNYGSFWHLDHKIPKSAFNYSDPRHVDFQRCWGLENLQPLEAKANLSKGAKLSRPFQPSLSFQL